MASKPVAERFEKIIQSFLDAGDVLRRQLSLVGHPDSSWVADQISAPIALLIGFLITSMSEADPLRRPTQPIAIAAASNEFSPMVRVLP